MRVFKWSSDFETEKESPIVPMWISFPNLKAHFYEKLALLLIAKIVGKPLYVDEATATQFLPSVARVYVEYDYKKEPMNQVWIVVKDRDSGAVTRSYIQRVEFAKMSTYCEHCCHVGHTSSTCLVLGNRLTTPGKVQVSKTLREEKREMLKKEAEQKQKQEKGKEKEPMLLGQLKQNT
ncbi:PREDICTED: uncharacterized protein LOC108661552 [Theobroma cacao]|uniref:Uncharacterized protein LOC108661552 n=1 Tax=Theobroma cacao TaxID=3641 RepID=A0AB32W9C4_THECC|nr:PREDICTED: uncharacterized protein LOC108661552 [Theobroma cacao]